MPAFTTDPSRSPGDLVFNLKPKTMIEAEGRRMIFERALGDGLLSFSDPDTGGPIQLIDPTTGNRVMPCTSWWMDLDRRGDYRILSGFDPATLPAKRPDYDHEAIKEKDEKAELRRFTVLKLKEMNAKLSDLDISLKLEDIWTHPEVRGKWPDRPAASSARRWYRKVMEAEHVRLIDMMSLSGRVARQASINRLDPVMAGFVKAGARFYYTSRGRTITDAEGYVDNLRLEENKARSDAGDVLPQLKKVARSTVARAVNRIRCFDTYVEKYGRAYAKRMFKVAGEGLYTRRALEIALIDDKCFDTILAIDLQRRIPVGRPWLCVIMDVHTRCILGYHITYSSPSVHTAVTTVKHAYRSKEPTPRSHDYPVLTTIGGVVSELIADNGTNYISPSFEDALLDVGTSLRLAAIKSPQHKAMLERFFHTIDTMLSRKLPGATLDRKVMAEMDYDPTKDAVLTIEELRELISDAIDCYHISEHSGIGMPPARAWEISALTHKPGRLRDPRIEPHRDCRRPVFLN